MADWGSIEDITWLLSRVGRALLVLAGIRFLTAAFPLALLQPEWYLGMARELINISPVLITGATVWLVCSRIAKAEEPFAMVIWEKERRVLRWVAVVYALLIPVQLGATVLFDRAVGARQAKQLQVVRKELKLARSGQELGLGDLRVQQLQAMEAGMVAQKRQRPQRLFSLMLESLRVCGSAAIVVWLLGVAFRQEPW